MIDKAAIAKGLGIGDLPLEEAEELARRHMAGLGINWEIKYYYDIKDKGGVIGPIEQMKVAQQKILAAMLHQEGRREPVRVVVAKSRKMGVTTLLAAYTLKRVMERALDAIVIAHDKESSNKIFEIYRRFYTRLKLPKPESYKGHVNLREIRFEGNDGHIMVQTGGNVYAGTALTPQIIHCSELAKWEHGTETLTSLMQSIGDEPGTALVVESTFNGREMAFLPLWEAASKHCEVKWGEVDKKTGLPSFSYKVTNSRDWNGFLPIFIGCLEDEDIWKEFGDEDEKGLFEQTLDDYERGLMERHGAQLEQLNQLRWLLKQKCQNDPSIRKQEYPVTAVEAVRASGRPRFNVIRLDSHPIEHGAVGRIDIEGRWSSRAVWVADSGEFLTKFRDPEPGMRYCIGVDTAGSAGEDADNTVIQVINKTRGNEQVAVYETNIDRPEHISPKLRAIAVYYNNAFVTIENMEQGNVIVVDMGRSYPRHLLFHDGMYNPERSRIGQIGFHTHGGNRHLLIKYLADAIEGNNVIIHDERTLDECRHFVYRDLSLRNPDEHRVKVMAARGKRDDHVVALCLALLGAYHWTERINLEEMVSQARGGLHTAQQLGRDSMTGY